MNIFGLIEAGFPTSASEEMLDTMTLDEYLIDNKEATYLIKVSSNSMSDSGILKGDTLVVERGKEAKKNDLVIAEEEGSYKMKYFKDIKHLSTVAAVIIGVIRKY